MGGTWTEPHRLPIGPALKTGINTLEVEVVNQWINRLLGDETLAPPQRRTYLSKPIPYAQSGGTEPVASGLFGPVRIVVEQ